MLATMLFFLPGYLAHIWDWGSCSTAAPHIYHNAASPIPIFYIGLGFGLLGIVCFRATCSVSTYLLNSPFQGIYLAVKLFGGPALNKTTTRHEG